MKPIALWILGALASLVVVRAFTQPNAGSGSGVIDDVLTGGGSGGDGLSLSPNAAAQRASRAAGLTRNLSAMRPGAAPFVWNPNAGAPVLAPASHISVGGPVSSYNVPTSSVSSSPTAASPTAVVSGGFSTAPVDTPVIFTDTPIVAPVVDTAAVVPIDTTPVDTVSVDALV